MNPALTHLTRARISLYTGSPMYGILAMRLTLVENKNVPTLAVSNTTIYYNPEYVRTLSLEHTKSALAHEVLHCVYDHLDRCGNRNRAKWNVAADYVINDALHLDGFQLNTNWLHNPKYRGMTADHVYNLLPDMDGANADEGLSAQDQMLPGDPADAAANAVEWKIATVQAAAEAAKQGKLPASMRRAVDEILGNKVDWSERLRRFVNEASKNDYSWERPNRRMVPFGYYLPSLYSLSMGALVIVIDTSGSIDSYTLNAFAAEVLAARAAGKPQKLIVIYCDAQINRVDTYEEFEQPKFEVVGGGGTDFRPPFRYIDDNNIKPACLVYLTDCDGTFPAAPPAYPVLWVTTRSPSRWGDCVKIDI